MHVACSSMHRLAVHVSLGLPCWLNASLPYAASSNEEDTWAGLRLCEAHVAGLAALCHWKVHAASAPKLGVLVR